MATAKENFRVIIAGGSISGLTLAHCLRRANIDFVILEANEIIAPQVGASVGILPNGARILDQLEVLDDIFSRVEPLRRAFTWSNDGTMITSNEAPRIIHERHGYAVSFLERQTLLQILFDHLGDYQDRVHLGKKVVKVENLPQKAIVHCADGSSYEGDLVVGADGVRSTVRQEMWRHMESHGKVKEVAGEKNAMTSEYSCVFGISDATPGLVPGDSHRTFAEGYSILTIIGKEARVYWFFFEKLDRKYPGTSVPRFSKEDLDKQFKRYAQKPITKDVPFSAVYERAACKTFLSLEEAFYRYWTMDRCLCFGDSIHKMTPNMGQGGNSAIESAAALANRLESMLQGSAESIISLETLTTNLQEWQEARQGRAEVICNKANELTRLEAGATFKHRVITNYLLPYLGTYLVDKASELLIEGEVINYIPLSHDAMACTMPYRSQKAQITAARTSFTKRVVSGIPFIGCFAYAKLTMDSAITKLVPFLMPILESGNWTSSNGEVLSLTEPVYNVRILDKLFQPVLLTCFLPSISRSDMLSHSQVLSFMTDLGPLYGVWLLESARKAHSSAEIAFPMLMGIAFQFIGVGKVAPIYFLIEYLRSPLTKLLHGRHEIKPHALSSFLPSILAAYYFPTIGCFIGSTVAARRYMNALWQLFPVTVPVVQAPFRILEKFASKSTRTQKSQLQRKQEAKQSAVRNLRYIRCIYLSFALASGLAFLHARRSLPKGTSVLNVFLPGLKEYTLPVSSFADGIARFLKYDEAVAMGSGFLWLVMKFRELKKAGANVSWFKVLGGLVVTTAGLGPGAALSLGWGWREELLAEIATAQALDVSEETS